MKDHLSINRERNNVASQKGMLIIERHSTIIQTVHRNLFLHSKLELTSLLVRHFVFLDILFQILDSKEQGIQRHLFFQIQ